MLKPYSEYKDSGVEWLGEIPASWTNKRLKYLARLINDKGLPDGEGLPINLENIESWTGRLVTEEAVEKESSEEEMKQFKAGDVLFNKLRPYLAKVHRARANGVCGGELLVLRPCPEDMMSDFLFYRLISKDFIGVVDGATYGTKMPRASWDFIGGLRIPYPSTQEQEDVSGFLDNKTARIDELIAKKTRMIELLKEERAAVINQAVTKGLDLNVEMKASGFEWTPRIPKKWHARPVKAFFDVQLGKMLQPESSALGDQLTPYLKAFHVNWGNVATGDLPEMWARPSDLNQYGIQAGDLLVCEGGEVGRAGIVVEAPQGCIIQNALHRVRARENYDVRFLMYVLYSVAKAGWFSILCNKATIAHLTREKLVALQIPTPMGEEQKGIADYLDIKTAQIDDQVFREERSIELLKEYRTALISEAVTGKIDVRSIS